MGDLNVRLVISPMFYMIVTVALDSFILYNLNARNERNGYIVLTI